MTVTLLANNAFHYPPSTHNCQRRMPMTTEQWKREIRTPWWNISLMATPVCAGSNVNTAARSSTPKPGTANIAASRLAVTRCWIWGKALKSALSEESIPALAAESSSYRFGQMPDIAAMPVGRKITAIVKQPHTLLFEELDKVCQVPYPHSLLSRKVALPRMGSAKSRNA